MRFLLYNIAYGAGIGTRLHFPFPYAGHLKKSEKYFSRIVEFVKSVDPDIVGLVEVDRGSFRFGKDNQAATLARELNHHHVSKSKYGETSVAQFVPVLNKQGNAVLHNCEIQSQQFHYFSKGVKRLVIEVELKDVCVFLVHLSLKFRHRHHQLTELYSMIQNCRKPVIVAGDFNTFEGDRELHLFMAAANLQTANGQGAPSYPSCSPKKQLDFICHSPEIRTLDFEVPPVKLSDHAPLVWDFEIRRSAKTLH